MLGRKSETPTEEIVHTEHRGLVDLFEPEGSTLQPRHAKDCNDPEGVVQKRFPDRDCRSRPILCKCPFEQQGECDKTHLGYVKASLQQYPNPSKLGVSIPTHMPSSNVLPQRQDRIDPQLRCHYKRDVSQNRQRIATLRQSDEAAVQSSQAQDPGRLDYNLSHLLYAPGRRVRA
jgi:hypothetical protein